MKTPSIKALLAEGSQHIGSTITLTGWVRAFRSNRFIQINDGSCQGNFQAVIDYSRFPEEVLRGISTGAALSITGVLVASIGSGQSIEMEVHSIEIIGAAPVDDVQKTVMQPKRHS
ncbi:MAG: OB-fold nucleic acid binding domain-containing protein, partial [Flavobacteriales bacterium]